MIASESGPINFDEQPRMRASPGQNPLGRTLIKDRSKLAVEFPVVANGVRQADNLAIWD